MDVCKLVSRPKDLRDSHLLPSRGMASFERARPQAAAPDPDDGKGCGHELAEIHDYVLCGDCEQRLLNQDGRGLHDRTDARKAGIPLVATLRVRAVGCGARRRCVCIIAGPQWGSTRTSLLILRLSVVLRAGAYKWRNLYSDKRMYSIELGPFLEPMRQFLLGSGPFPVNVSVNVQAASDTQSRTQRVHASGAPGTPCPVWVSRMWYSFCGRNGRSAAVRLSGNLLLQLPGKVILEKHI